MAVTGTLANSRKWRLVVYMLLSAGFSAYCYYDGWKNPKYQDPSELSNMWFNRAAAVGLVVLLVVLIIRFLLALKTRVVMDEAGLDVDGKLKISWPAMTRVDDRNLEKGLLDIYYTPAGEGSEKKYTLDNYKVTPFEEMVEEVSRHRPDLLAPIEEEVK
jgi:hypothetical protein